MPLWTGSKELHSASDDKIGPNEEVNIFDYFVSNHPTINVEKFPIGLNLYFFSVMNTLVSLANEIKELELR